MTYDKSSEKVLHSLEIPDYEGKPEWGGTVLQAVQYMDKQPQVVLSRYRVDKATGEKKYLPFISIPACAVGRVTAEMVSLASNIETNYPKVPKGLG
jgi:predicted Abi (CAAX) family protease